MLRELLIGAFVVLATGVTIVLVHRRHRRHQLTQYVICVTPISFVYSTTRVISPVPRRTLSLNAILAV